LEASELTKDEIEFIGQDGNKRKVPSVSHTKIPGLCVTSANVFGEFDITHRTSAMTLCRGFERMWEAFHYMAELQKKAIDHGFDWNVDKEALVAQPEFQSSGVKGDLRNVTTLNVMCQFPWEDQHPVEKAQELIDGFDDKQHDPDEAVRPMSAITKEIYATLLKFQSQLGPESLNLLEVSRESQKLVESYRVSRQNPESAPSEFDLMVLLMSAATVASILHETNTGEMADGTKPAVEIDAVEAVH